jgi:hypothetical protein
MKSKDKTKDSDSFEYSPTIRTRQAVHLHFHPFRPPQPLLCTGTKTAKLNYVSLEFRP